jgi:hypothetical protein
MAEATSPAAGRPYGVARVCRVWEVARSSFYAARQAGADGIKRHPELDSFDMRNWTPGHADPTAGPVSVFRFSSPDRLFSRRR